MAMASVDLDPPGLVEHARELTGEKSDRDRSLITVPVLAAGGGDTASWASTSAAQSRTASPRKS